MFKKDKEREKTAKMIRDEAKKMSTLFQRLSHATNPKVKSTKNSVGQEQDSLIDSFL